MKYRAILNIDFTKITDAAKRKKHVRKYQDMVAALNKVGWVHFETSAWVLSDESDVGKVWRGIEVVAKASTDPDIAKVSALTFHVHGSDDFSRKIPDKADKNRPKALDNILAKDYPKPIN